MIFAAKNHCFELGEKTYTVGIVNITPDSFSDGGMYLDTAAAVAHARQLEADGADILDLGAYSTRPGHTSVSPAEEIHRLAPVLAALAGKTAAAVSVDTFQPETAQYALSHGADIINDVSGQPAPAMAQLIREYGAGWVILYAGGAGQHTVQAANAFFAQAIRFCTGEGIDRRQLCLDCGFGFGKTAEENYRLLACLDRLDTGGCALMAALSKKSMLGAVTGRDAADRTEETLAADTAAVLLGADFIRVHDVKQSIYAAKIADEIRKYRKG